MFYCFTKTLQTLHVHEVQMFGNTVNPILELLWVNVNNTLQSVFSEQVLVQVYAGVPFSEALMGKRLQK